MKKKLKTGIRLIPYGVALKVNLVLFILMFILGILFEVMGFTQRLGGGPVFYDLGAIFFLCMAMCPGQMTVSTDLSAFVQSSPCKKTIQTSMLTGMNFVFGLVAVTVLVVFRLILCAVTHTSLAVGLGDLWYTVGLVEFALLIFFIFVYKYFVLSMVILYVCMLLLGGATGLAAGMGKIDMMTLFLHPAVSVLASYALLFLGAPLGYLVSCLLYKKKLSKFAFGSALQKK